MTAPAAIVTDQDSFAAEDRQTRELLRDLHQVRQGIYWADLLVTSAIGWTGFAFAVALRPFSLPMLSATGIAVIFLYRALCFVHEISHQTARTLPYFEASWNILIGYPLLLPSFAYVGVHQSHHKLSTYGTKRDPEYLPFARSARMTLLFTLQSLLMPVFLIARFLFLSPVGLISRSAQQWLIVHCSSLTINPEYRREVTPGLIGYSRRHSAIILVLWCVLAVLALTGRIPWHFLPVWIAVSALISFINTLRTLAAHAYESSGEAMSRAQQLADSIDTPGAPWTEIWAPVGLRYHALHHYFSGIPYHNLGKAWQRLSQDLPADAQYHRVRSRGLLHSLCALWHQGIRRSA
jgi:fatty acid desaturase